MNTTTFIRAAHGNNFSIIDNTIIKERRLSAKAKGLLTYILSLPDDWILNIEELQNHFTDGKESINNGIKELEKFGYFIRNKLRDNKGRIVGMEYLVIEKPNTIAKESLGAGFQKTDKPFLDNQQLLSTDKNKELINKETRTKENTSIVIDKELPKSKLDKEEREDLVNVKKISNLKLDKEELVKSDIEKEDLVNVKKICEKICEYYKKQFIKKKGHNNKLAKQRIKKLLESNTEKQLINAIDEYKKTKAETIQKQEWQFIKTTDTFFGFEKGTRIYFIERYITEEKKMKQKVKPIKTDHNWLNDF